MNWPLRLAQSVIPKRLHWLFHLKHSEIHGRARWMNGGETQAFLSGSHDGLAFGAGKRLSREESSKNLVLLAPTGSGKTTRYVIPNLLQLQGSAVVTDPSGEIYRATSGHLARRGYRIQVLQPAAPQASLGFNPLACFGSTQELRRLATILCESGETGERFWTIGAVNILTLCLKVLSAIGDARYLNLANARWLLNHIGTASEAVRRTFAYTYVEYPAFARQAMNEAEYREFLGFLFERYVRPRLARLREHHLHHLDGEFSYHLHRAVRSGRMVRFIESDCKDKGDIYRTFTLERIEAAVSDTLRNVAFSNRTTDDAGFLDALESHLPEIADGLLTIGLPEADENILREMGSVNPQAELRSLAFRAKRWMERRDGQRRDTDLRHELEYAEEKLKKEAADFQERIKAKKEQPSPDIPKKGHPWFKAIGQIGEGAALSIANIALAAGALQLPVSPETQTWGSITSVSVGLSTFLCGIGELRDE